MDVVHSQRCGLDVHKQTVVACVLNRGAEATAVLGRSTRQMLEPCVPGANAA